MGKFNLLDEPWVSVVYDDRGATKEVSLLDLFQNAHNYKDLAGDTKTQDFAVLRVLLAVLHTVFSRFDADGQVYDFLEVDNRFRQLEAVDEDDLNDYEDALYDAWVNLWNQGQFPEIISQYLEKWRDRFYLFDEEYPFFQVRKEDIQEVVDLSKDTSKVFGKNINRTVSESNNTYSIFSPRDTRNKDALSSSEIARWLLTYQGYSETGGIMKAIGQKPYSRGWLYNLGGIFLKGSNIFETLLMNLTLFYFEDNNHRYIQHPCWESDSATVIENYILGRSVDNLAELYTSWGKAIYIAPEVSQYKFNFRVAKIPDISKIDMFLEPMTLWQDDKGKYKPQLHRINESLWRSFGLIVQEKSGSKKSSFHIPGIIDWQRKIKDNIGNTVIDICAVGIESDKTANNTLKYEIFDTLSINKFVLTDLQEKGWVTRINDVVEETKTVVSNTYRRFIDDIRKIRNIRSDDFTNQKVEECYFKIDQPFRQWLSSIQYEDEKDQKVFEWRQILKKLVLREVTMLLQEDNPVDYIGRVIDVADKKSKVGKYKNIAIVYDEFTYWLNQNLKVGK